MLSHASSFDEEVVLKELKHYLPTQSPLKDFVHHNTLHAFQELPFHEALKTSSRIFGYKNYLQLKDYRSYHRSGKINDTVLNRVITTLKGEKNLSDWKEKLLNKPYNEARNARIGSLRTAWKDVFHFNLDKLTHPLLFRVVSSYLDQGIALTPFPSHANSFLDGIRELENNSVVSYFKKKRARALLHQTGITLAHLLHEVVGDESQYGQYLFDQQFAHPGWSGMVAMIDENPSSLLNKRNISLHDFIFFELLLEIDVLDAKFGENWSPIGLKTCKNPIQKVDKRNELDDVYLIWQEAFEWTYYDQVAAGLQAVEPKKEQVAPHYQAMFCIDDRESSIRRYAESEVSNCETFGTPGHFNIPTYFLPEDGKFYTKVCPAPITPKHVIIENAAKKRNRKEAHFSKHSHSLVFGWLSTQTVGLLSAIKLYANIFHPRHSASAVSSFSHMHSSSKLTIENKNFDDTYDRLQVGFTITEMTACVAGVFESIGLRTAFAPLVYFIGHGASSINNTHYAGYDCGACSGRPGSVNARAAAVMANHPEVRNLLAEKGIVIPKNTWFVGALHDTTKDEAYYYDTALIPESLQGSHHNFAKQFKLALHKNASERSRRFLKHDGSKPVKEQHSEVKKRAVSLFEPRPEYNHATNCLCIISKRETMHNLFLDRRAFLNSYNYLKDPEGVQLGNILGAAAPVCAGINLEYYFSRMDSEKLGAGSKLPHNVMGLIGVANGADGDLRPGLPYQMVEIHDPLRLMMIIEHNPDVVQQLLEKLPATKAWFAKEWVHLLVVNPTDKKLFRYKNEQFEPYIPLTKETKMVDGKLFYTTNEADNLPVYITEKTTELC